MNVLSTRIKGSNIAYSTRHMKQGTSNVNFTAIKNQYLNFENRITELENKLNEKDTVITSLLEKITTLESNIEQRLTNLESSDLETRLEELETRIGTYQSQIDILNVGVANLRTTVDEIDQDLHTAETTLDEQNEKIVELQTGLDTKITALETATKDYYQGCVMYEVDGTTFCVNIPETLKRIDDAYLKKIDENCGVLLSDFDGYDWKTLPSNQDTMKTMVISDNQTVKSSQYSQHDIEQQLKIIWNQLSAIQALL